MRRLFQEGYKRHDPNSEKNTFFFSKISQKLGHLFYPFLEIDASYIGVNATDTHNTRSSTETRFRRIGSLQIEQLFTDSLINLQSV